MGHTAPAAGRLGSGKLQPRDDEAADCAETVVSPFVTCSLTQLTMEDPKLGN